MAKFYLKITMGNDEMQTFGDVVDALERTAKNMRDVEMMSDIIDDYSIGCRCVVIKDINGNTVGRWGIEG